MPIMQSFAVRMGTDGSIRACVGLGLWLKDGTIPGCDRGLLFVGRRRDSTDLRGIFVLEDELEL